MIGGARGVKAEMQMEHARVSMGKIAIRSRDVAQIGAPVGARSGSVTVASARSAMRRNSSSLEPK